MATEPNTTEQAVDLSALELYKQMYLIRTFELQLRSILEGDPALSRFVHLSVGQESVAVGVCAALRPTDFLALSYRNHGVLLARGADCRPMMAEILGKATGVCGGRAGSMHLLDSSLGIVDASGIVGGQIPIANGSALAAWMDQSDSVTVCFFGDGAIAEGSFHESLNIASLLNLPVVYVCENNQQAVRTPYTRYSPVAAPVERAAAYGIPAVQINDSDVLEIRRVTLEAVNRARTRQGPTFIECKTRLFLGHYANSAPLDRVEEARRGINGDPVLELRSRLSAEGFERGLTAIEERIRQEVYDAAAFALESPYSDNQTTGW